MILSLLAVQVSLVAPVPKAPAVTSVVVEVDATEIKVGDPLLMCATFQCGKGQTVTLKDRFSFQRYALHVEVCKPDGTEFSRVLPIGQGLDCNPPQPTKYADGARVRCFGTLVAGERSPFSEAGKWKLRVRALFETDDLLSEPITIRVVERTKAETAAMKDYQREAAILRRDRTKLVTAVAELGECNLVLHFRTTELLRAVFAAEDRKRLDEVLKAVAECRPKLNDLHRENLDIYTAQALLGHPSAGEKMAVEVLKGIPHASIEKSELEQEIDGRRRESEYRNRQKK